MKFNSFFLAQLLSLIISFNSFAQKAPIKFGEVALEDLKMEVYENDSSASAVVLADFGTSFIDYRVDGFKVVYERHIRIKILNRVC
ncbi:MAG: hypothetical protein NWS46_09435 [Cyclobacteriaceae bacterium]|jgi:hypothetical protein|nr:hypothetical protein [Cyclobacteriaceae bacterium]